MIETEITTETLTTSVVTMETHHESPTSADMETVAMETSPDDVTTSECSSAAVMTCEMTSRLRQDYDDDQSELKSVLDGSCSFNDLPPINKKLVRIFLSSTFAGLYTLQ